MSRPPRYTFWFALEGALDWGVPGITPIMVPWVGALAPGAWGRDEGEGSGLGTYRTDWCRGKKFLKCHVTLLMKSSIRLKLIPEESC